MSDTDSPEQGSGNDTALTVEAGAAAIENLLSSVPDDESQKDSVTNEESTDEGQQVSVDSAPKASDDEEDGLEFDDEAPEQVKPAPEDPQFKAGQFASRDAKVKLDDGTTLSVAELITGNMFQRTFTEKTTALSQEKKALEAEKGQFAETKQQIEHQRNVILTLAQELIPQEPQFVDPNADPIGYMNYLAERDAYQQKMNKLQHLWNSTQQEQAQLTERQKKDQEEHQRQQQEIYMENLKTEQEKLFHAIPRLKDEAERQKFFKDAVDIGQTIYGVSADEIQAIADHRYMRILADALAFRKAIAKRDASKQPQPVSAQAQAQQPRIQQRQRMAPQTPQAREAGNAADRLRKTGSIEDAAKALMKFV